METLFFCVVALGVGLVAASIFWLREQRKQRDVMSRLREDLATNAAHLEAKAEHILLLTKRSNDMELQIREITEEKSTLQIKAAELETALAKERTFALERLRDLQDAQKRLTETFQVLSSEALQKNNQSFLDLAKQSLSGFQEAAKGDLEKRQQAIDALVKPVKEGIEKFDGKIAELEKARVGAYEGLTQQVAHLLTSQSQLRLETGNLVKALRAPQVRGRWGEIQLKRVVELAGMLDHCDFYEQQSVDTGEGRLRPDLLIRLPGKKSIVIDAKAPLAAYLDAVEEPDDERRSAKLDDHARQIKDHLAALGRKAYWEQFQPAPEFAVLFLPGEAFFSAALERDPSLIERGIEERVILATPTTLIALLKAVAYGWRQESVAENAQHVCDLGKELHKRVADFASYLVKTGKSLENAVQHYNSAVGCFESRVLVSTRRFQDLKITAEGQSLAELPQLTVLPRSIAESGQ